MSPRSVRTVTVCLTAADASRLDDQFGAGLGAEVLHLACSRVHALPDGYSAIPLSLTVRTSPAKGGPARGGPEKVGEAQGILFGLPDEHRWIDDHLGAGTSARLVEAIVGYVGVRQTVDTRLEVTVHTHAAEPDGEATVLGIVVPDDVLQHLLIQHQSSAKHLSDMPVNMPANAVREALSVGMPVFYGVAE